VLAQDLRLEAAVSVARHIDVKRSIFSQQRLAGIAVAAVGVVRWLVPLVNEVLVELRIQCRLDRDQRWTPVAGQR
jgi:hypothetical protein